MPAKRKAPATKRQTARPVKQTKNTGYSRAKYYYDDNRSLEWYRYALDYPLNAGLTKVPYFVSDDSTVARYINRATITIPNNPEGTPPLVGKYFVFQPYNLLNSPSGTAPLVVQQEIVDGPPVQINEATKLDIIKCYDMSSFAESVRIVGARCIFDYIDRWDDYSGYWVSIVGEGGRKDNIIVDGQDRDVSTLYKDESSRTGKVKDLPLTFRYHPTNMEDFNFFSNVDTQEHGRFATGVAFQGTTDAMKLMVTVEVLLEYKPFFDKGWYIPGTGAPYPAEDHQMKQFLNYNPVTNQHGYVYADPKEAFKMRTIGPNPQNEAGVYGPGIPKNLGAGAEEGGYQDYNRLSAFEQEHGLEPPAEGNEAFEAANEFLNQMNPLNWFQGEEQKELPRQGNESRSTAPSEGEYENLLRRAEQRAIQDGYRRVTRGFDRRVQEYLRQEIADHENNANF